MSNSYTKAAFGVVVTAGEAQMLNRVIGAIEMIGNPSVGLDTLEAHYLGLGADFAALFPRTELNPFDGLLDLFPDSRHPYLDFDVDIGTPDDSGQAIVYFSGEQFDAETAANLIQRCARSALPYGFEYASDCDKLRAGEFGGGYVVITEDTREFGHTSQLVDRAIGRARDEGADGFVLVIRHPEHGLSFWNDASGFDRLTLARVFSETEASSFEVPLADDQPEWLAMPAPLRF